MGKLFVLLLIVTVFTGIFWLVMSGYVTERLIAMDMRTAARQNDAAGILEGLQQAEQRLVAQRRWVVRFAFVARDPDWSHINESRETLQRLQRETNNIMLSGAGDVGSEPVEQTRRYLRAMTPLDARVFREGQDTLWKVLFWVVAGGTFITGLLLFVRRAGD